jgi:hypothetical protein
MNWNEAQKKANLDNNFSSNMCESDKKLYNYNLANIIFNEYHHSNLDFTECLKDENFNLINNCRYITESSGQ